VKSAKQMVSISFAVVINFAVAFSSLAKERNP